MKTQAPVIHRLFLAVFLIMAVQFVSAGSAMASLNQIKAIHIKDAPLSVSFEVTGKSPIRVIRISDREVLVAIKGVRLAKGYKVLGRKHPAIASVHVESLDGDVVAVVVGGKQSYGRISSSFNASNTRLTVALGNGRKDGAAAVTTPQGAAPAVRAQPALSPEPPQMADTPKGPVPAPLPAKPEHSQQVAAPSEEKAPGPVKKVEMAERREPPAPQATVRPPKKKETPKPGLSPAELVKAPPVYVPPKRAKSDFRGDISDIHRGDNPLMGCEAKPVENALLFIRKELYKEAHDILDQYMFQENFSCLEQVYYLKAFVYHKSIGDDDYASLLKAEQMYQDALVSYPQSSLVPFAYTGVGMIQSQLKNISAAEGYLNIVKKGYQAYTGMPEVQYYLARIYDEKGYTDKALRLYKEVFQSPLDNSYIIDAGVGYGKALFDKRQYYDALSIFNYVIKNDAGKIYESPDLLRYAGDASFELGLSKDARKTFMRLLNLFPEIPDRDMVLSRVGDAYGMENQEEKAIKIYELVREKFPDTQGFINASIGIARYLKTDGEKIEIYQMVKARFPENTYARIAMMRLAEIYQKNGEYDKCIQEIEDLLSTHPRGLRYEAVKLMQRAYEALFKEKLEADEYTSVLNRYELEHHKLDKMNSRIIASQVGAAYLQANLYEEAFNHLITAYKQYKRSQRSPKLLFGLGEAMDESGRDDDALRLFASFAARFPKTAKSVDALTRMGGIYAEKKQYQKAAKTFERAYGRSKKPLERGRILMYHSDVAEQKGDLVAAAGFRARAVKEFTAAPGKNYETLATAYKALGSTYLELKSYPRAAEAFSKALQFSEGDRTKANIGFLLGDAYQRGNILDKAKEAFEQVAGAYDSVWARLAEQRLSTMDLAEKMINS